MKNVSLTSEGIDGLIVMPCHGAYYTWAQLIIEVYIVIIDKKLDGIPVPSVRPDNNGHPDLGHLKSQGCENLVSSDRRDIITAGTA